MLGRGRMTIIFNRPYVTGRELGYIQQVIDQAHLSGNGEFARRCQRWLERQTGTARSLLTHSCTGALEMSALLLDVRPGDAVIMPPFTFVSTANAFVLRGAVPVFVDIRPDTLNLDERLIEAAIGPRTRVIAPVHYGGGGGGKGATTWKSRPHSCGGGGGGGPRVPPARCAGGP